MLSFFFLGWLSVLKVNKFKILSLWNWLANAIAYMRFFNFWTRCSIFFIHDANVFSKFKNKLRTIPASTKKNKNLRNICSYMYVQNSNKCRAVSKLYFASYLFMFSYSQLRKHKQTNTP